MQIQSGELAGQVGRVLAWRVTRPPFLLGESLDGEPQVALLIMTPQGEERWLAEADVVGLSEPSQVTCFQPFSGGDEVLVNPSRSPGQVRRWEVTGRRLETIVIYRVHLAGTLPDEMIEVDERHLELRPRISGVGKNA